MSLQSMQQANSEKIINIEIASSDLEILKRASYKLCFAKKINNSFNVVWQASGNYLSNNQFSWTPQYQLFGSNYFTNGKNVHITTNVETCDLGFSCTLNATGILQPQAKDGRSTCLTFKNEFGPIHDGVSQMCKGIDGTSAITPVYVAENQIIQGYDELTPKDIIRIWFQQDINTSTMIGPIDGNVSTLAVSKTIEIDVSQTDTKSCRFENGDWTLIS